MIEEADMTVRENVHQVVDMLPDDRLDDVLDYLAEMSEPEEMLRAETLAGIREGLEDIRLGRTMSLEEYRRSRGL
jgi:predicted transcriptional regulator